MKKMMLLVAILFFYVGNIFADQLAYISKAEAEQAAKLINGKNIILFCGCCEADTPLKVKVLKTEVRFTNYENYYEVYITYKNANGETVTEPIDLAYVWILKKKKLQTVGKIMNLEHDPCLEPSIKI